MIRFEVQRLAQRLGWAREIQEDLYGYAQLAYLEARRRFDPSRGVQFETYAAHRVRGALYDGLSAFGEIPRRIYRRLRAELLAFELAGPPTIAPMSPDKLAARTRERIRELALIHSLDQLSKHAEESNLLQQVEERQRASLLWRALRRLPEEQQTLLVAVYDLCETGDSASRYASRLAVHRSTITRRHRSALRALEEELRSLGFSEESMMQHSSQGHTRKHKDI